MAALLLVLTLIPVCFFLMTTYFCKGLSALLDSLLELAAPAGFLLLLYLLALAITILETTFFNGLDTFFWSVILYSLLFGLFSVFLEFSFLALELYLAICGIMEIFLDLVGGWSYTALQYFLKQLDKQILRS